MFHAALARIPPLSRTAIAAALALLAGLAVRGPSVKVESYPPGSHSIYSLACNVTDPKEFVVDQPLPHTSDIANGISIHWGQTSGVEVSINQFRTACLDESGDITMINPHVDYPMAGFCHKIEPITFCFDRHWVLTCNMPTCTLQINDKKIEMVTGWRTYSSMIMEAGTRVTLLDAR